MEQTTEEMVLNHKGYKTVVFLMEKDNHRFHQHWTMKIGENPIKVGFQLAKDLEYGYNQTRKMFGQKGKITCNFIEVIRS